MLDQATIEETRIASVYAGRDEGASRYSWFSPGHRCYMQQLERHMLTLLQREGLVALHKLTMLEIGCGSGQWLCQLVKWGARPERIYGMDLRPESVQSARARCPQGVSLHIGSATSLPYPDASMDLVVQCTVFSSVLDRSMRREIASDMLRVLKPGGAVLWYDMACNNPWNPDIRGLGRAEIEELFPGCQITVKRVTVALPVQRRLAPWSSLACTFLERLLVLNTHYLGVIRRA